MQINADFASAIKSPAGIESIKGDKVLENVGKLASYPMTLAVLTDTKVHMIAHVYFIFCSTE